MSKDCDDGWNQRTARVVTGVLAALVVQVLGGYLIVTR
jgi:hypothetical protein